MAERKITTKAKVTIFLMGKLLISGLILSLDEPEALSEIASNFGLGLVCHLEVALVEKLGIGLLAGPI